MYIYIPFNEFIPSLHTVWHILIITILIISLQNITQNETPIAKRLSTFFSINSVFRLAKLALCYAFVLLIISDRPFSKLNLVRLPIAYPLIDNTYSRGFIQLAISIFIISFAIYIVFNPRIRVNLGTQYKEISYYKGFFFYFFTLFVSVSFFSGLLWIAVRLINWVDGFFVRNSMSLFDWLLRDYTEKGYSRGAYFAFILAVILSIIILTALFKDISLFSPRFAVIKYILSTVVLFFGLFSGLYSVLNFIYNFFAHEHFSQWIATENQVGYLTLRITSFSLLVKIIKYTYKYIFKGKLNQVVMLGLLPNSTSDRIFNPSANPSSYASDFFSQLGFYILAITTIEICVIFDRYSLVPSLLSLALFYIIDDWEIVYDYYYHHQKLIIKYQRRIITLNVVIFSLAFISIISLQLWTYLIVFVAITAILWWVGSQDPKQVTQE